MALLKITLSSFVENLTESVPWRLSQTLCKVFKGSTTFVHEAGQANFDADRLLLRLVDAVSCVRLRGLDFEPVLLGGGREETSLRYGLSVGGFHQDLNARRQDALYVYPITRASQ